MEATVLLRHEVKSVDDYYETPSPVFRYNSFSNLQQTAICGEVKKVNNMLQSFPITTSPIIVALSAK